MLGALLVTFLLLAAVDVRGWTAGQASQQCGVRRDGRPKCRCCRSGLARGSALASQGQPTAFAAVKDSRERFKADLDALAQRRHGARRDARRDAGSRRRSSLLSSVKARWERSTRPSSACSATKRVLTTLAKGLEGRSARATTRLLELAQQAATADRQAGGIARDVELREPARRAVAARSRKTRTRWRRPTKSIPRSPFLLGKDVGTLPRHAERAAEGQRRRCGSR